MGLKEYENSKNLKYKQQIEEAKTMEIFQDGDMELFNHLLSSQIYQVSEILNLRNHEERTPLHLACRYGYVEIAFKLIKLHRQYGISLDPVDKIGDTPLTLVCSHGNFNFNFDALNYQEGPGQEETIAAYKRILKNRYKIVQFLLHPENELELKADIKKSFIKKRNNPLHWAIYYGDFYSGKILFKEYPLMIMEENERGHIPLELFLRKNIRKCVNDESTKLVQFIMKTFIFKLFDKTVEEIDILKNSNEQQKTFFNEIYIQKKLINKLTLTNLSGKLQRFKLQKQEDVNKITNNENEQIKQDNEIVIEEDVPNEKDDDDITLLADSIAMAFKKNKITIQEVKKQTIYIYDEKDQKAQTLEMIFLHKMLLIAVGLKNISLVQILIEQFSLSPFFKTIGQESALSYACLKCKIKIIQKILSYEYLFKNTKKFDLKEQLNKRFGKNLNTCLHNVALGSQGQSLELFQYLVEMGADPMLTNYMDYTPLELNQDINFQIYKQKIVDESDNIKLQSVIDKIHSLDTFDMNALQCINFKYQLIIICRDPEQDYQQTLIYDQLQNLRCRFSDLERAFYWGEQKLTKFEQNMSSSIEIKYIKPMQSKINGVYRHYFLVSFDKNLTSQLATYLNFQIYNKKQKYTMSFSHEKQREFINFRDFHIHQIIEFTLNREFNLEQLKIKGIIEAYFPLHDLKTRENIKRNWNKEKKTTYFDPWKIHISKKDLRPFNSIAFYFGCDLALYVSFTVFWTSFLLILTFVAFIFFIIVLSVQGIKQDYYTTIWYAVFLIICVTIVYERWKQRENTHAYLWNTENSKKNEIQQRKFFGFFSIDQINKQIKKKSIVPAKKRKMIVEIPLILIGVSMIILTFIFTFYFQQKVEDLTEEDTTSIRGSLSHTMYCSILTGIIGGGNGALIFIFTEVYRILSVLAVNWENHKLKSQEENSFITKTFIFNFFISYMNLFYFAFVKQDFDKLSLQFVTILLSKNILFLLKMNLIPFLLYKFKLRNFLPLWKEKRKSLKKLYYQEMIIQKIILQKYEEQGIPQYIRDSIYYGFIDGQEKLGFQQYDENGNIITDCDPIIQRKLNIIESQILDESEAIIFDENKLVSEYYDQIILVEKQLILQDQVEISNLMPEPPQQIELWMNNVIQYGYICFFSLSFPIMTIYGVLINILHISLIYSQMTSIMKRKVCKEQCNIGIWKKIIMSITIIALIINSAILMTTSEHFENFIQKIFGDKYTTAHKVMSMVIVEHITFLLIFLIIKGIKDIPDWLNKIYKSQEYRKNLEIQINKKKKFRFFKMNSKGVFAKKKKKLEIRPTMTMEQLLEEDKMTQEMINEYEQKKKLIPKVSISLNKLQLIQQL